MSRYRLNPKGSDQPLADGDDGFLKFASRRQSALLEAGTLELSENMRLDRNTAKVRSGIKPAVTDLVLTNPPVVFDFTFGVDILCTITRAATTATVTTGSAHGYTTGNLVNIRGAVQTAYNGDFSITVTGANTFTYTVAGAPTTPATGTIYSNKGPVLYDTYSDEVRCSCKFATNDASRTEYIIEALTNHAYAIRPGVSSQAIAYPALETVDSTDDASMLYWNGRVLLFRGYQTASPVVISSITRAATTATATTVAAHGFATNDWVFIDEVEPLGYCGIVQITVTGGTTFTYTVGGALTTPATVAAASKVRKCKRPLCWDGNFANAFVSVTTGASVLGGTFYCLPPVPWAIDFSSRLVIPYKPDQVLISDPYNSDVFDTVYTQFRVRYGSSDHLVAATPTQGGVVFVLCSQSLHRIILDGTGLAIGATQEITRDAGCISRRSVKGAGGFVLWLDNNGVRRARQTDELNLIVEESPLSADVQDIIDSINRAALGKVTATVWNNRYYLALPTGTNTKSTVILIYNFLNDGWETKDTFPSGFDVEDFHQMDYNGVKRLFVTTTYGHAYILEETEAGDTWVNFAGSQTYTVPGQIRTRYFLGGTREIKRCRRMELEANLTLNDAFTGQIVARNPDLTGDLNSISAASTNDGVYPIYAGLNGSGAQLRITTTAGRPEFRAVLVDFTGVRERSYNRQT